MAEKEKIKKAQQRLSKARKTRFKYLATIAAGFGVLVGAYFLTPEESRQSQDHRATARISSHLSRVISSPTEAVLEGVDNHVEEIYKLNIPDRDKVIENLEHLAALTQQKQEVLDEVVGELNSYTGQLEETSELKDYNKRMKFVNLAYLLASGLVLAGVIGEDVTGKSVKKAKDVVAYYREREGEK